MVSFFLVFVKAFIVLNLTLSLASFCTWFERKGSALMQDRVGANRAGSFVTSTRWYIKPFLPLVRMMGVLGVINTLFCDSVKGLMKEDFVPEGASKFLHALAPFLAVLPIILAFSVLPLAPEFVLFDERIRPQVSSIDGGLLFVLAMGSVAVYGVALAGWTGNNKFSLLGALRAAAQMISYELAMGLAMVSIVVCFGTLDVYSMVMQQGEYLGGSIPNWGIVLQPVGFVILLIAGMAETKRAPFDLPEAESELVAGYMTEYSGMKFLLFWLGEFAEIALFSTILALLYFGGWHIPFIALPQDAWWAALIGHVVLITKIAFFCMLQIVIRWSLPRLRYDHLMNLGWKCLLPLSMVNLLVTAAVKVWG